MAINALKIFFRQGIWTDEKENETNSVRYELSNSNSVVSNTMEPGNVNFRDVSTQTYNNNVVFQFIFLIFSNCILF